MVGAFLSTSMCFVKRLTDLLGVLVCVYKTLTYSMANPEVQVEHAKQNIKLAVDNCIFTVKDGKLFILLIKIR